MLALVVLMIYWIAALKQTDDSLELLLLPLPVVILGGLFWAPLARWIWEIAKRRKGCRIGGPGMHSAGNVYPVFPDHSVCGRRSWDAGAQPNLVRRIPNHRWRPVKRGCFRTPEAFLTGMGKAIAESKRMSGAGAEHP